MFKLLLIVLVIIVGYVLYQTLPDVQRYMRIRAM